MWPDRVSNPGPLALESDALPTALRGPTVCVCVCVCVGVCVCVCTYTAMSSVGNFTLKKSKPFFPEAKTSTCKGKSFHNFRVAKQTFIPTYMHQKIL